jgi:hypothetical protein
VVEPRGEVCDPKKRALREWARRRVGPKKRALRVTALCKSPACFEARVTVGV